MVILSLVGLWGCGSKIPHMLMPDYGKTGTRLVAIMPVINQTTDARTGRVLRAKVMEELYFKGYPKIPLELIDERLAGAFKTPPGKVEQGDPKVLGALLGVDALMWITLEESRMSVTLTYAQISVAARFEMRSAKTGEILWQVDHRAVDRNYSYSKTSVELKAVQFFEPVIQELTDKVLKTLPDGPDA